MAITTDEQLKKMFKDEVKKVLQEIAKEISDELTKNINSDVYGRPNSDYYKRTFDFLNAVIKPDVKINGDTISVKVGMDYEKIRSIENEGFFNAHMSIDGASSFGGRSISSWILNWYDSGTSNAYLPSVPATNYFTDVFGGNPDKNETFDKLDKLIDEKIKNGFSKFGITYES